MRNWVLPENFEDILPPQAQRVERMRAKLLELFRVHGYELVIPPMLEYLESLLTGTGHVLDLRTFKLVDQISGRMMGVRADITPQVARIDAHLLNRRGVTRLCYCGSVLHTRPASPGIAIELGADHEILRLLSNALQLARVRNARIAIGHVAIFRSLARAAGAGPELEAELFEALQKKDVPGLDQLTKKIGSAHRKALLLLPG